MFRMLRAPASQNGGVIRPVTPEPGSTSPSAAMRDRAKTLLAELTHLQEAMGGRLAEAEARLGAAEARSNELLQQVHALQQAEKQAAAERKRLLEGHEAQLRQQRDANQ